MAGVGSRDGGAPSGVHRNEVALSGRLAAAPEPRELPSGDALVVFRLVVAREETQEHKEGRPRPQSVDTIDCVAWRSDVRRRVQGWAPGDVVAVEGALRRRFWRAGSAAVSRCEVEVARARRLQRAG